MKPKVFISIVLSVIVLSSVFGIYLGSLISRPESIERTKLTKSYKKYKKAPPIIDVSKQAEIFKSQCNLCHNKMVLLSNEHVLMLAKGHKKMQLSLEEIYALSLYSGNNERTILDIIDLQIKNLNN